VGSMAGRPEDGHSLKRGYLRPRRYSVGEWSIGRCEFGVGLGREGCLSVRLRRDVAVLFQVSQFQYPTFVSSKYGMCTGGSRCLAPTNRVCFRLQRMLILISAIAKSSPFHLPRRLTDCNDRFLVDHMEEDGPTLHAQ